jgi:hypothetical protein
VRENYLRGQPTKPSIRAFGSSCPLEVQHIGCSATGNDVLQPLIPETQHVELALYKVGANIVAYQRSCVLAARLMADHGGDKIERLAHLCQHCRNCPPQIMRVELVDR